MADIEVVPAGLDGWERVLRVDELAFGYTWDDERDPAVYRDLLELDRTRVAVVDGVDAGIASTYSLEMSLPGVPRHAVAGLTWVGVLPTHRRRGVLNALMTQHLTELHETGRESVAALWASEPGIYGRYGYGLASRRLHLKIPTEHSALLPPRTDAEPTAAFVDAEEVRPQLALIADQVAAHRAGFISRNPRWWDRALVDPPSIRDGASALRCLLVADHDGPRGYALYRTKEDWGPAGAQGSLRVDQVVTADTGAHLALWRVLLGTDLMSEVTSIMTAVDDPLLHLLANPRRALPILLDAVYTRPVDVDLALAARTYASEVDVVLDITDPTCPWNTGRWRLSGAAGGATCAPTTEPADLACDIEVLGAVYLGGTSLRSLADAGLVTEHTPGAVDAASIAFSTPRAPWTQLVF